MPEGEDSVEQHGNEKRGRVWMRWVCWGPKKEKKQDDFCFAELVSQIQSQFTTPHSSPQMPYDRTQVTKAVRARCSEQISTSALPSKLGDSCKQRSASSNTLTNAKITHDEQLSNGEARGVVQTGPRDARQPPKDARTDSCGCQGPRQGFPEGLGGGQHSS